MKAKIKELLLNKRVRVFSLTFLLIILVFGIGATLALITDATNALTNTFQVEDLQTHIEENVGTTGTTILKEPVIVNDGSATAFIRARITVSPDYWSNNDQGISLRLGSFSNIGKSIQDEISEKVVRDDVKTYTDAGIFTRKMDLTKIEATLFSNNTSGLGWYYSEGWYYYNKPVKAGTCTTPLFDAVVVGSNVKENFDITIYQEAVSSRGYVNDEEQILSDISIAENSFKAVTK